VFLNFSGWWVQTAGVPLAGVAAPAWTVSMLSAMGLLLLVCCAVFFAESHSPVQRTSRLPRAKAPRRFRVIVNAAARGL